jgi:hypothetical protein
MPGWALPTLCTPTGSRHAEPGSRAAGQQGSRVLHTHAVLHPTYLLQQGPGEGQAGEGGGQAEHLLLCMAPQGASMEADVFPYHPAPRKRTALSTQAGLTRAAARPGRDSSGCLGLDRPSQQAVKLSGMPCMAYAAALPSSPLEAECQAAGGEGSCHPGHRCAA